MTDLKEEAQRDIPTKEAIDLYLDDLVRLTTIQLKEALALGNTEHTIDVLTNIRYKAERIQDMVELADIEKEEGEEGE